MEGGDCGLGTGGVEYVFGVVAADLLVRPCAARGQPAVSGSAI